jgi:hypothetical protein
VRSAAGRAHSCIVLYSYSFHMTTVTAMLPALVKLTASGARVAAQLEDCVRADGASQLESCGIWCRCCGCQCWLPGAPCRGDTCNMPAAAGGPVMSVSMFAKSVLTGLAVAYQFADCFPASHKAPTSHTCPRLHGRVSHAMFPDTKIGYPQLRLADTIISDSLRLCLSARQCAQAMCTSTASRSSLMS